MARNTKEKAQETRERIIDAAIDVFYDKGVSNTSLNDVAHAAKVTRGAIYWHFKNKADLFDAMCAHIKNPIHLMVEEVASEKTPDPLGLLRVQGAAIRRMIVDSPKLRKIMTIIHYRCEITDKDDSILLLYRRDWLMHGRESTKRILSNAIAKGQLPPDLDLRLASILMQAAFNGLVMNWLLIPESFDLVSDGNVILESAIDNLRTNPSLRLKPDN